MTLGLLVTIQIGMACCAFATLAAQRRHEWDVRLGALLLAISMGGTVAVIIAEGGP